MSENSVRKIRITCTINGVERDVLVDPRDTVLTLLRDRLGLTGTKEGCSNGNCGSCTVLVDTVPTNACLMLAHEAQNHTIETIEGLSRDDRGEAVQQAIIVAGATQCGFCTPGIVASAVALLKANPSPTENDVRHAIAGNLCRCTGYDKIVRAICSVAAMSDAKETTQHTPVKS